MNRVELTGRLTRDIELKKSQSGKSVTSFTLAVNRKYKQEGQPEADFINCVAWNGTAEYMANYMHKGLLIEVEGRIQTRNYEDRNGNKVYVTEIICDNVGKLEFGKQTEKKNETHYEPTTYENDYDESPIDIASDDLPF